MKLKLAKLRDLIFLTFITNAVSPKVFGQTIQPMYGIEPEPMPRIMYGPPQVSPDPQENLLPFLLFFVRIFALPLIILTVFVVGIVFLVKKILARKKKNKSESPEENS